MNGKKRTGMNGSFTVEASLVVSMILLVLFYVLQMTFFLTDTARLEAALAETSLGAAQEADMNGFFLLDVSGVQTENSTGSVTYEASDTLELLPGFTVSAEAEFTKTERQPVAFLRQVKTWYTLLSQGED
ncbi:MAG: hypothetical protein LUF00_13695 [Lachnospiraceae bacterium]|nr:hypothetical protein [Lachnospiraceae bacterium]